MSFSSMGLELIFRSVCNDLQSKTDALVSYLHWILIANGFKCAGNGEQPSVSDRKSELLPNEWNSNQDVYTLRYVYESDGKVYLLKCVRVDNTLIVNLLRNQDNMLASATFKINEFIGDPLHDFHSVYSNIQAGRKKFTVELLEKVGAVAPSQEAQREPESSRPTRNVSDDQNDPLRVPTRQPPRPLGFRSDFNDPLAIGRNDLDPFGFGGGGGMLMDPRGLGRSPGNPGFHPGIPGQLPRGSVPPGARFDPLGPGGGPRAGPDNDHLPPPGYDDMFM